MVAVVEVELQSDGVFVALMHDVRGSADVESVPSLDRFAKQRARVRVGSEEHVLTVYEQNGITYVALADLTSTQS